MKMIYKKTLCIWMLFMLLGMVHAASAQSVIFPQEKQPGRAGMEETPTGINTVEKKGQTARMQGLWSRHTTLAAGKSWNVSAVVGLMAKGQARRSFLAYSERERAVPWRAYPVYISWYELNIDRNNAENYDGNMTVEQCTDIVAEWKRQFFDKYHTGVKAFVWDDGWDSYGTWTFNKNFPNGFSEPDAVWRQEADYSTIGDQGSDRERWITYRDRLVYQNFVQNSPLCPINTLMTHGFILSRWGEVSKDMDYDGIVRELRCAFACGSSMVELYNDYKLTLREALDIPAYMKTRIVLSDAFAQGTPEGLAIGQEIDIDAELSLTLPASSVFIYNGTDLRP